VISRPEGERQCVVPWSREITSHRAWVLRW
jgi:hypothetical protein